MSTLLDLSLPEFRDLLQSQGIQRCYLVWDAEARTVRASHPLLEPLAEFFAEDPRDFDGHEGFFLGVAPETNTLQGACVHRTCRGQGAGGVRYWHYDTVEAFLRDGLRLSMGMTHKNALAGLWWGGGKGLIAKGTCPDEADLAVRRRIYEEYGEFMSGLRGCYVTAEDVGTSVEDMRAIFSRTRFTTCIPQELGGSGNPSAPTARGVVRGIQAALAHLDMGTLEGKSVAVQGLGHVGEPLIGFLHAQGVGRVVGSDIDPTREEALRALYPGLDLEVRAVERGDASVLFEPVDVVSPNAVGGVLNAESIPKIQARIVCGAANNQLQDPARDDQRLRERGVLYLPDFLVNRMGIVNCADEQFGTVEGDEDFERHLGETWENSIYNLSRAVLRSAEATDQTPAAVALRMAQERSRELHPLWGHRGQRIIEGLVRSGWAGSGR